MERELKLTLDAGAAARMRAHPAMKGARAAKLVSAYFDTADRLLSGQGYALRVRREGGRQVQTVKRSVGEMVAGLSMPEEVEFPMRGDAPVLVHRAGRGLLDEVRSLLHGRTLERVFETRVERRTAVLDRPGGRVELALDLGEIVAGGACAPVSELELELAEGGLAALYDAAEALGLPGPLRFSARSKAARGFALADTGAADAPPAPRLARRMAHSPDATAETALRDALRDCLAQIAVNLEVVADSDAPGGPHQLRVGLRRLRTALWLFRDEVGPAAAPLREEARAMAREVGRLRDRDVLAGELVPGIAAGMGDHAARDALVAAIEADRLAVRAEVRAALAESGAAAFPLRLGRFVETRGWLDPSDWDQTGRLARPLAERGPALLDRCLKRVLKRGRHPDRLTVEARHDLRKALKTLRYAIEFLTPGGPDGQQDGTKVYLKRLKALQEGFGQLNDAAMADALLCAGAMPGLEAPGPARAAGFVQGALSVRLVRELEGFRDLWDRFRDAKPFWRR